MTIENANKRTYLPIEMYIPQELRTKEFFKANSILIDYTENNLIGFENPKYAMIEQAYRDIGFKYKNIMELSEDALIAELKENGFGEIVEVFNLPLEKLQMLVLYLPLFKMLKGTDAGFNLILSLISYDYKLTSWLEDRENLEEFTYELTFVTLLNVGFSAQVLSKLRKFARSYVYPILTKVVISAMYRVFGPAVYGRPRMKKSIKVRCFDDPTE